LLIACILAGTITAQDDPALVAKAKLIHSHVLKLDTHNDIDPSNFTPDCNYTMRLATQVNLPKMIEGGMDVTFMIVYVGQGPLTPAGYDQAVDKIIPTADALAARGVDAISLFGTSLTFYRGPKFNEELQDEVRARTRLPVSSMSSAIVEGLRAVGATRVAVATAYIDVVNDRLRELLEFHGFEVGAIESFGITDFGGSAGRKTGEEIMELVDRACEKTPEADGIVISPGPKTPAEAGLSIPIIRRWGPEIPILGVCLGHQAIGEAYGGRVVRARRVMHGKRSAITHDGTGLFQGLPSPLDVMRYHSLVVEASTLPEELTVLARGAILTQKSSGVS